MTRFLLGIFALLVCFTAHAQTQETPPNKPVLPLDKQQVALQSLATEITKTTGKLDKLETDLAELKNEDERAAKNEDITAEQARLDQLRTEFISVAANVDLAAVD
ncbi:septum formation initiator family protein, partial [Akkermansiaceae bacterium]|nr:septum formation initiator family protein [Akkermansiaceae bacterium]